MWSKLSRAAVLLALVCGCGESESSTPAPGPAQGTLIPTQDTLTLNTTAAGHITDLGSDGTFDEISGQYATSVWAYDADVPDAFPPRPAYYDVGIMEYNISAFIGPVGTATLRMFNIGARDTSAVELELYGYTGNGMLDLSDGTDGSLLTTFILEGLNGLTGVDLDVSDFVQNFSGSIVGFRVQVSGPPNGGNDGRTLGSVDPTSEYNPTLTLTPPVPTEGVWLVEIPDPSDIWSGVGPLPLPPGVKPLPLPWSPWGGPYWGSPYRSSPYWGSPHWSSPYRSSPYWGVPFSGELW